MVSLSFIIIFFFTNADLAEF